MNERDKYISDLLDGNRLLPKPGHLWCEKLLFNEQVEIDGVGAVTGTLTKSGLVLVSGKDTQDEAVLTKLLIVRAVGAEPARWRFRFFGKEFNWKTTFKEQCVEVGTVVAVRAVAGMEQDITDRFIEIRYDEISAIGQPPGQGEHDMLPAPGWVAIDVAIDEDADKIGSLFIRPELVDALDGQAKWGKVLSLPRGYHGELREGMDVAFDRYKFVEFMMSGTTRFMPQDELLAYGSK